MVVTRGSGSASKDAVAKKTSWRLRWYPRAIAIAVGLAFLVFVATSSGPDAVAGRLGQDFPAFHAAGGLVLEDPDSLYDPAIQAAAQVDSFPDAESGFLYFAYPPYAALLYSPFAAVPFQAAYVLWTLLMVGCVVLAFHLLRPQLPFVDRWFEQSVIAAMAFYPMFRAVFGGQNTAVTLLLLAVAWRTFDDDREWVAGLALAGLLFKPHFALPFIGLALLARRWRVVGGAALGGAGLYATASVLQGPTWPIDWLDNVRWFSDMDTVANGHIAVSFPMAFASWFGVGDPVGVVLGWALSLACLGFLLWLWWKRRDLPFRVLAALSVPLLVLASPHTVFYDAGLLVVTLAVLAEELPHRRWAFVSVYLFSMLHLTADDLRFTVILPVVVGILFWAFHDLVVESGADTVDVVA